HCPSPNCFEVVRPSAHAVAGEFVRNIGLDELRGSDVAVAARDIAAPPLGQPTSVEGRCMFRLDPQCGVVVGNGVLALTYPEVDEAATVDVIEAAVAHLH